MRCLAVAIVLAASSPAVAGVSGFRLSELATASSTGDPAARYVELEATAAGCLFPTTAVVAYDAHGVALGEVTPFASTTCFAAGTFLLLATPEAQAAFMTAADVARVPPLPALAGQVCLVSSTTRYDCVRWGAIATPVHDLFAPDDDTSAFPPPAGLALARRADTGVVAADWRVETPSPRRANDGEPWDQGDAGIDAAAPIDASADAEVDAHTDATPADARVDANPTFLDLDPRGGAACGCGAGTAAGGSMLVVLALAARLTRRRSRRPRRLRRRPLGAASRAPAPHRPRRRRPRGCHRSGTSRASTRRRASS